jgi:biotin carboxyl carrier protein
MKYKTTVNGQTYEIEIDREGRIRIDGEDRDVDFQMISPSLFSAIINNASYEALVEQRDDQYVVQIAGDNYDVQIMDERQERLARTAGVTVAQGEISIRSPMPGLIVAVPVQEGQSINQGDPLVVLESMKMENEIKAPRAGTIAHVHVAKGDRVEQNKTLITIA